MSFPRKFPVKIALMLVSASIATSSFAGQILPPDYALPSEPNPQSGGCTTCSSSASSPESVFLNSSGFARMDINLNTLSALNHALFLVELGKTTAYMPSTIYQLLMPGAKDGLNDSILVRIGDQNIGFDLSATEADANRVFRSKNYQDYSLSREQSDFIVKNTTTGIGYVFSSEDGGANWRFSSVRDLNCPAKFVKCEYSKDGLVTAVINPDDSKYVISYNNGLPSKVVDPAGATTDISYDVRGHISGVKTSLLPAHPLYPKTGLKPTAVGKPFVMRDVHLDCDAEGRILSLVNTEGEKYLAEYQQHTPDKAKKDTAFTLGTLKKPDGSKIFVRVSLNADGSRVEAKGKVIVDKGAEVFRTENETILKSKSGTLSPFKKIVNGRTTEISRDGATTAITSQTDPLGRVTKFEYDSDGHKIATIYPDGSSRKAKYDSADRIIEETDEMGRTTAYGYEGDLLKLINDKGLATVFKYDKNGLPVETVEPGGRTHKFEFDKLCRMVSYVRPDGVTTRYSYLKNLGLVDKIEICPAAQADSKQKSPDSYVRKFAYEPWGRLASITYPDNTRETFKYFCCGLVEYVDRAGGVTKYAYDSAHRKVLEVSPIGAETKFEYDVNGKLTKRTSPDKTFVAFVYDSNTGERIEEQNSDGRWEKYEYNDAGERIKVSYSDGTHSELTHDKRGRVIGISGDHEKNIVREYNEAGDLIAETDHGLPYVKIGRKTEYKLDSAGRVVTITNPDGSVTGNFYNEKNGKLIAVVENGIVTRYGLDSVGRINAFARYSSEELAKCKTSEDRQLLFENNISEKRIYDAFGNLFEIRRNKVSQGQGFALVARYDYSPYRRLNSILIPVSESGAIKQTYLYSYKSDGIRDISVYGKHIESADLAKFDFKDEYGTYQIVSKGDIVPDTKNDLGLLLSKTLEKAGLKIYSINTLGEQNYFEYDKAGRLSKILDERRELQSSYAYDKNGRLDSTIDPLGRIYKNIYGKEGRLTSTENPLGEQSGFDYNEFGMLSGKTGAGGYDLSYTYTSFGEIASYTDGNGSTTKFEYDNVGRPVKRIWPDGSHVSYSFNEKGLLEKKIESDRITEYYYDNLNRMVKFEISQGTKKSITNLRYNADSKLVDVAVDNGRLEFAYDGFSRIISEKGIVGSINYKYDSAGKLSEKICEISGRSFSTKYSYDELDRIVKVSS
ncbi:MAG: hypothetical protein WAX69_18430, partial [Victivallales bacterium]